MVCFLAPIEASILFNCFIFRQAQDTKQLKKILRIAGIWFIKMPERFAPNYFIEIASFLAMTLRS